jgi:hypothetical protein
VRKSLLLSFLVVALLALTVLPAAAEWTWCWSDPNVKLPGNGGVVHVKVGAPADATFILTIHAPAGSKLVGHMSKLDNGEVELYDDLPAGELISVKASDPRVEWVLTLRGDEYP